MPPKKSAKAPRKSSRTRTARGPKVPAATHSLTDSFAIRTAFVVVGVLGLAAIGISLIGPRRFRDEFVRPIGAAAYTPIAAAVAPSADRVWEETRAWRDRIGSVLESINTEELRQLVASRLSYWIDQLR